MLARSRWLARGSEDEVTIVEAGSGDRPVGHDLHEPKTHRLTRSFGQAGREWCRGACNADVVAAHAAFWEERTDDASSGVVD